MKTAVATLCLVLFATTMAFGQQANQQVPRKGRTKMWTGVGLIAAGLVVVPVTAAGRLANGSDPSVVGVGLVAAGGTLVFWGVRDQRKGTQPNTTFGVIVGRKSEIHIRRSW